MKHFVAPAWLVAFACAAVTGCVDPGAARDAFVAPTPDTSSPDAADDDTDGPGPDVADAAPDSAGDSGGDEDTAAGPTLPPESASLASLWDGDARWVAPLPGGALLVVAADGWWWVDAEGARRVTPEDDAVTVPEAAPTAAAGLSDGTALVAAGAALYRLSAGVLGATPLSDALGGAVITDLASPDGATLWVATEAGLWRWRDALLAAVAPPGLPVAGARVVCGAPVGGRPGVWIAAAGQVYALTDGDAGLEAWPEQPNLTAVALGADASGALWVVDDVGDVQRRTPDAIWSAVALPEPVGALAARAESAHVWLFGVGGRVFHAVGDTLSEVTNAPGGAGLTAAASPDGSVLLAGGSGVTQVAPGRVLALLGANPGTVLWEVTAVTLRASEPDAVSLIDVRLDAAAVTATPVDAADGRVWRVDLDPVALDNGDHRLDVEVTYGDDGTVLATALPFRVAFPTWGGDVAPLYVKRCSACHDAVIGAATVVLEEMSAWTSQIDCIVCRVSTPFDPARPECMLCQSAPSSMPPTGALLDSEIELIRRWDAGGLREE